jgi:ribonuclease E
VPDDAQLDVQSEDASRPAELPERLRIFSLARLLGTTSRTIIDALAGVDGKFRNPASTVTRAEAERVRDLLGLGAPAVDPAPAIADAAETEAVTAAEVPAPIDETPAATVIDVVVDGDEPESRLMLETVPATVAEPADYLPLFVAPQPVKFTPAVPAPAPAAGDAADIGDDDSSDEDTDDGALDEDGDRQANRRRRRGRRGRGRGRGEQSADEAGDGDTDL